METLTQYRWPGNIRELRSAIERAFVIGRGEPLSLALFDDLFAMEASLAGDAQKHSTETRESKKARVAAVLAAHGGNKAAAARALGVTRRTIYTWLSETPAP
jgi:transcriptional regulator with PAS, ATPase and Fis domain